MINGRKDGKEDGEGGSREEGVGRKKSLQANVKTWTSSSKEGHEQTEEWEWEQVCAIVADDDELGRMNG
jgi:hypothetical protein